MISPRLRRLLPLTLALGCLGTLGLSAQNAQAATYPVTNLNDSGEGTLRAAITVANANADTDNIVFADGLAGGTLTLAQALPDITSNLSILNSAAENITLARSTAPGTPAFKILVIDNGVASDDNASTAPTGVTVSLQGLTLTNGRTPDTGEAVPGFLGGGLYTSNSTVSLTNCTVAQNTSGNNGGGIYDRGGVLTLTNCTVARNTVEDQLYAGGGIRSYNGTLTLNNCTVSGNTAGSAGGGVYTTGNLTCTGSTISGNTLLVTGSTGYGEGGGVFAGDGTVALTNTIISGNAIFVTDTGDATNADTDDVVANGGGLLTARSTATVTNCTITNNTAFVSGVNDTGAGGIQAVGGGFLNDSGTLTITSSTVSGNAALSTNNISDQGGGFFNQFGAVTITNSTLSGNTSSTYGGGFFNFDGTLTMTNSTVSGNTAYAAGGGIVSSGDSAGDGSSVTLTNVTVSGNAAPDGQGSGIVNYFGSTTLANSIVAGNTNSDVDVFADGPDTFASNGYNLVGSGGAGSLAAFSAASGDQINVTAEQLKLGKLADNGGLTQTLALLPGSIAFNAGNPNSQNLPSTDQRGEGFPRVVGGRVDVGAVEAQFLVVRGKVYNAVARAGLSGITVTATPSVVTSGVSTNVGTRAITTGQPALTDEQGNYTLYLDAGAYTLSASKGGNTNYRFNPAFSNPVSVTVQGTGSASYDFRNIGIGGRVINPSNKPVQGVTLALSANGTSEPTATLLSDAEGFFSFDGLAAGTYTIVPSGSSNLVFAPLSQTLTLANTPLFTSFKASAKINYALTGTVAINQNGKLTGLKGVTVTATRRGDGQAFITLTGNDGGYSFATLTEGSYTVTAQAPQMVFTYAPTPSQPQPLVLTAKSPSRSGINFTAQRTIGGTVYNAVALQGLKGVLVKAVRQGDNQTVSATTDSAGAYTLSLGAGNYTLSASLPNNSAYRFITAFSNPVTIPATVPSSQSAVPAYNFRGIGIGGRIISPSNAGIGGVTVSAYAANSANPVRSAVSDSDGFFSLDGLAAGNYTVMPVNPNTFTYAPASRVITVQDQPVFTSFKASAQQSNGTRSVAGGAPSSLTLSVASASAPAGTLTLKFTGALDAASAAELSHYSVQVNGVLVSVTNAALSNGGDTLVLTLPQGALTQGSQVVIGWSGVLDMHGLALRGSTQLTVS